MAHSTATHILASPPDNQDTQGDQEQEKDLARSPPGRSLAIIRGFLHGTNVVSLQKAMGCYLGDVHWRSRINSDLFHEASALTGETFNWMYLSLELEESEDYSDEELQGRRWVL
ncbi:hypothetical protein BDV10DRAFT_181052 [Aspergillus recurvatus]